MRGNAMSAARSLLPNFYRRYEFYSLHFPRGQLFVAPCRGVRHDSPGATPFHPGGGVSRVPSRFYLGERVFRGISNREMPGRLSSIYFVMHHCPSGTTYLIQL